MEERFVTRREALKKAALAGILLPLVGTGSSLRGETTTQTALPTVAAGRALRLGLATYSLRKMSGEDAIRALGELKITSISLFRVHLPILESIPDACRATVKKFTDAGLSIASTGVVTLTKSEGSMRRVFECGRAAGLTTMTASYAALPDRETLLLTEKFVREYDIRLAFHNHGPEDSIFPSPYDVWKTVEPYDARMGLCIDVGHSARAGVDPTEAILKCRSRLYDVHLKDTAAGIGAKKDIPVILGFGRLDLRSIMAALIQINYPYQAGLEYEVDAPDPVPGIAQSFGYMRGLLEGLSPRETVFRTGEAPAPAA